MTRPSYFLLALAAAAALAIAALGPALAPAQSTPPPTLPPGTSLDPSYTGGGALVPLKLKIKIVSHSLRHLRRTKVVKVKITATNVATGSVTASAHGLRFSSRAVVFPGVGEQTFSVKLGTLSRRARKKLAKAHSLRLSVKVKAADLAAVPAAASGSTRLR